MPYRGIGFDGIGGRHYGDRGRIGGEPHQGSWGKRGGGILGSRWGGGPNRGGMTGRGARGQGFGGGRTPTPGSLAWDAMLGGGWSSVTRGGGRAGGNVRGRGGHR